MDNHIALIHMLMGTKLILKWIIIVEVSLLAKKVFLKIKKPVKNYASGQYDYYHGVLNVKINKMDNAEYNYLKGKL